MKYLDWIRARAKEPSTHAALTALLGLAITTFPQYGDILGTLGIITGISGVVMKDKGGANG